MSEITAERVALHLVRHLVRGLGKTEGQGASIQSLRHWWRLNLGQRSADFERGLDYAGHRHWIENGPDGFILLTSEGSAAAGPSR